jgi:hypothetical protein
VGAGEGRAALLGWALHSNVLARCAKWLEITRRLLCPLPRAFLLLSMLPSFTMRSCPSLLLAICFSMLQPSQRSAMLHSHC